MRVKAKRMGWNGERRCREGDIFSIRDESHFSSKWMEKVGAVGEPKEPKGKQKLPVDDNKPSPASQSDKDVI